MGSIEELKSKFSNISGINLTTQQSAAVTTVNGKVLLLAVPGSGKTTVLIMRLGYMIYECGIRPEEILTMTYTVAAAEDMRRRFSSFFGDSDAGRIEFRTINGVCSKIMLAFERKTGRHPFDLISDEKQISEIVAGIMKRTMNSFPEESDITDLRTKIAYIKNMMLTDAEIDKLGDKSFPVGRMYRAYCEELTNRRQMDYDDQMVYAYKMLKSHPWLLEDIRKRFKYICVDEAQDTSKIQHEIISMIAGEEGNLFMVGDEDQSIYGFRAACPDALVDFERNHKGAIVLCMEQNFRSDGYIVAAADRFINKNMFRHKKTMISSFEAKQNIAVPSFLNRTEQYGYLLGVAKNHQGRTAVLYRNNDSAVPLVDLFEREGISYNLRQCDTAFFTSKTVRDVTDIINFALDPCDTELFRRLYFKLGTYLSKENAAKALSIARAENIPVLSAALSIDTLNTSVKNACRDIGSALRALKSAKGSEITGIISYSLNYRTYLSRMGMDAGKLQLISAVAANCRNAESFLRRLSELKNTIAEHVNVRGCDFILSTIHSAKGLEYDTVYLIDVCDGTFPECQPPVITRHIPAKLAASSPSKGLTPQELTEMKAYEEERRLFYVGMTRAKKCLKILAYKNAPSSFTDEVYSAIKGVSVFTQPDVTAVTAAAYKKKQSVTVTGADIVMFRAEHTVNSRVMHKKFGILRVTSWNGNFMTARDENGKERTLDIKTLLENGLISGV